MVERWATCILPIPITFPQTILYTAQPERAQLIRRLTVDFLIILNYILKYILTPSTMFILMSPAHTMKASAEICGTLLCFKVLEMQRCKCEISPMAGLPGLLFFNRMSMRLCHTLRLSELPIKTVHQNKD